MKLTLAEPKYLKESISIISELVNEAKFIVSKDAIELVAMDPANVAMVIFKLLASSFVEYDVTEKVSLAINLNNLKQILRRAKPSDIVTIQDGDGKLTLTLKGNTNRKFSIPVIDIEDKEQKIPDLKFVSKIQLPSAVLNEAIEDVDIVGESVGFLADENLFTVEAEGDLSNAKIEIKPGDDAKIQSRSSSKAKYSVEYLKKMVSASKLADKVELQFSNDYPLRLDYKTVDKVMLSFILAPRVENE